MIRFYGDPTVAFQFGRAFGFFLGVLLTIAADVILAQPADCADNTACLSWTHDGTDVNGDPVVIASYRVFWGYSSRNYSQQEDVGDTKKHELVFTIGQPTTFFFAVTAISEDGDPSAYSNEVQKTFAVPVIERAEPTAPFITVDLGDLIPSGDPTDLAIFDSAIVTVPLPFPNRPELSRASAQYLLNVKLNAIGVQQTLFSKDEIGMNEPGHTTLWVMPDGTLLLRHQGLNPVMENIESSAVLSAGVDYEIVVDFDAAAMILIVDGANQGSITSYGMAATSMPTVIGGACHQCQVGTTDPILLPIDGQVRLRVYE